ncbi:MAG: hypothetical protein ABII22_03820 [Candidatus Micrarchaeota archaeon]
MCVLITIRKSRLDEKGSRLLGIKPMSLPPDFISRAAEKLQSDSAEMEIHLLDGDVRRMLRRIARSPHLARVAGHFLEDPSFYHTYNSFTVLQKAAANEQSRHDSLVALVGALSSDIPLARGLATGALGEASLCGVPLSREAIYALVETLSDPDSGVSLRASDALAKTVTSTVNSQILVPVLIARVTHELDEKTRQQISMVLAEGVKREQVSEFVVDVLTSALSDIHPSVRKCVAHAFFIAAKDSAETVVPAIPALVSTLSSTDPAVRMEILNALSCSVARPHIGAVIPKVVEILNSDCDLLEKEAAMWVLINAAKHGFDIFCSRSVLLRLNDPHSNTNNMLMVLAKQLL